MLSVVCAKWGEWGGYVRSAYVFVLKSCQTALAFLLSFSNYHVTALLLMPTGFFRRNNRWTSLKVGLLEDSVKSQAKEKANVEDR